MGGLFEIIWNGFVYDMAKEAVSVVGGYLMSGATDCCNGVGGGGDLVQ